MTIGSTPAEIIKRQAVWLDKLQALTPKPILIKCIEGAAPEGADYNLYAWTYCKDVIHKATAPIYTRAILLNELLFDPDVKNWDVLKSEFNKIIEFCRKEEIPLQLAYSGGNGIHGSIIFNSFLVDNEILDQSAKMDIDLLKIVRNVLVDLILAGAGTNRLALSLDPKKINFSKNRSGSQVREYGTTRPDGHFKTLIDHIPKTKTEAQELPLVFPDETKTWQIPEKYNRQINEAILKAIEKSEKYLEYNTEAVDLRGNELKAFPCLSWLLKHGTISGNRHYGAGSITLMAKRCGSNWPETQELIKQFFSKCEITPAEVQERINNNKNYFDNPDYHFSCREIKNIFGEDVCKFLKCILHDKIIKIKEKTEIIKDEIPQHIKEEADRILNEGKAIDFLMNTCSNFHVGDETTIRATFGAIGSQSVENSSGIQPKVSGGSGKGKSHAEKTVFHLTPREYILETSLSAKALFHANIKPGTIIFSDDADIGEDLEGLIKRSTTNFQEKTNHTLSIKNGSEWTAKTVTIPERIIWALTSVNDTGSLEYINRQFNLGVDETPDQDLKVWNFIKGMAKEGKKEFHITDDVLICREIIRDIKKHLFRVKIPYVDRIKWNNTENRRNGAQFLDFIKSFAVFNYRLRDKTDNIIEANEDDFFTALKLYGQRAPNQRLKLNDTEIAVLKTMAVHEAYTLEKLQELTKKSYHTLYRMFHGREGRKGGLLEKVPGLTYKPETEFIGDSEIINEHGNERTVLKKTKPKHVYVLTVDFNNLLNFDLVAELQPETKP